MKSLLVFFLLALSTFTFAGDTPSEEFMSVIEQEQYLKKIASGIRKEYWVAGHQDVQSRETFVTKAILDDHVKKERRYHDYLDTDQVSDLYRCYYRKNCELYLVRVSSDYWGGYGETAHFVMMYTDTRRYFEHNHVMYSE